MNILHGLEKAIASIQATPEGEERNAARQEFLLLAQWTALGDAGAARTIAEQGLHLVRLFNSEGATQQRLVRDLVLSRLRRVRERFSEACRA